MEPLNEEELRKTVVVGCRLPGDTLWDVVHSEQVVIVHFLRHLGCIFCQYGVDQLHELKQKDPRFPTIFFVHQSPPDVAEAFFAKHFPGAPHISDPKQNLYRRFGILRLNAGSLFNPLSILKGIKITLSGYATRLFTKDDVWVLSGTFLFNVGKLIWSHRAKFAGDDPRWEKLGVK
jgi:thiol-disulfide isomerase/thioredoxin